jgi:hypothetical protein
VHSAASPSHDPGCFAPAAGWNSATRGQPSAASAAKPIPWQAAARQPCRAPRRQQARQCQTVWPDVHSAAGYARRVRSGASARPHHMTKPAMRHCPRKSNAAQRSTEHARTRTAPASRSASACGKSTSRKSVGKRAAGLSRSITPCDPLAARTHAARVAACADAGAYVLKRTISPRPSSEPAGTAAAHQHTSSISSSCMTLSCHLSTVRRAHWAPLDRWRPAASSAIFCDSEAPHFDADEVLRSYV